MTTATLSTNLRVYATKRWPLDKDERRKERLATLLNMTKRRVRSLWENESTARPRGAEIERIEALISAEQEQIKEATRAADRALEARFAALETEVADLRAALARAALEAEGVVARRPGAASHENRAGHFGRRSTD